MYRVTIYYKLVKFLFLQEGLQGLITIEDVHTHTVVTSETLRFLKPADGLKETFFEYFNDRMTITEARNYNEKLYEFDAEKEIILANSTYNPTYRTVQNWHDQWREHNLGPRSGSGMIEVIITVVM